MKRGAAAGATCLLAILASLPRGAYGQSQSRTRLRAVPPEEQALHDLLVKAKSEADNHDYASAQSDYQKYLEQRPNDATAHFDLGYVYTAQQQKDKAIAEYRRATELDPQMIQAQLNLGISLVEDDPKAAIGPLQKVIQLNYAFARGHYMLGAAEERSGDTAGAEKEFTVAVKLDPNDADAHRALGRREMADQKAASAEAEFRELLKLKPDDAQGQLGLAQSLRQQKKTAEAVDALSAYLRTDPSDTKARLSEASALAELGKNDQALAALDLAAKQGPESLDALKLRAEIDYGKRDFPGAAAVLRKAAAIAPNDPAVHAQLGNALLETKDYPGAASELNTALRLNPDSADTLRDLVSAEYLDQDFPGALVALDRLGHRETLSAGAWFLRGSCYDHMNQPELALDAYQKFLSMNMDKNSNQYFEAAGRVRYLQKVIKDKGH